MATAHWWFIKSQRAHTYLSFALIPSICFFLLLALSEYDFVSTCVFALLDFCYCYFVGKIDSTLACSTQLHSILVYCFCGCWPKIRHTLDLFSFFILVHNTDNNTRIIYAVAMRFLCMIFEWIEQNFIPIFSLEIEMVHKASPRISQHIGKYKFDCCENS